MENEDLTQERQVAVEESTRLSIENEDLKARRHTMIEAHAQELQDAKSKLEMDLVRLFKIHISFCAEHTL